MKIQYEPQPHNTFDDEEARQYLCRKCGAVLVTDNHSAVSHCCFCGSQMTLGERLSGDYAPEKIVPFQISKEEATKAFHRWCRKLKFAPKEFLNKYRQRKVVGIFIPVWLFDVQIQGEARLHATKTNTIKEEKKTTKETEHYRIHRKADLTLHTLPCNASQKLPDYFLKGLEPFAPAGLKNFSLSYLSGYVSEKYHQTDQTAGSTAKKRSQKYMDDYILESVTGYETVEFDSRDYTISATACRYALVPVWMVYCDGDETDYIFAMNGQTGKIAANPPISKPKVLTAALLVTFFIFLFFRIITLLLGGPLL